MEFQQLQSVCFPGLFCSGGESRRMAANGDFWRRMAGFIAPSSAKIGRALYGIDFQ
jgi:hypothetical protein